MPPPIEKTTKITISALWFAWWQTLLISATFGATLYTSIQYHWAGIVKNEWYSEWWPSISAVVGDDPPERNVFAYGMAVSGPAKVVCCLLIASICSRRAAENPSASSGAKFWAKFTGVIGFIRLLAAAGWIFITSSDNGIAHAVAMAVYLVFTCFYFLGHIYATVLVDAHERSRGATWKNVFVFWWRIVWCAAFIGLMCAAIVMFIQHKMHKVIGAYGWYSVYEWGMMVADTMFDAAAVVEFIGLTITVNIPFVSAFTALHVEKAEGHQKPSSLFASLVEIWAGFISWTLITELITLVWFFPLVYMDVTGQEAMVILYMLPPVFLWNRSALRFFSWRRSWIYILSLFGIASLLVVTDLSHRLAILSLATGLNLTSMFASWWRDGAGMRAFWAQMISLIIFVCVRMALLSVNPISAYKEVNFAFIGISVLGLVFLSFSDARERHLIEVASLVPLQETERVVTSKLTKKAAVAKPPAPSVLDPRQRALIDDGLVLKKSNAPYLRAGTLVGAVFYMTHYLFTSHGVIARYVDVQPFPAGIVTVICMTVGLFTARWPVFVASPIFGTFGMAGCMAFYYFTGWIGFAGGCALTVYIFGMWPYAVANIRHCGGGRALWVAMLWYILGTLGSIWVVAYNFVPFGGAEMRESPQYVLFTLTGVIIFCSLTLGDRFIAQSLKHSPVTKIHGLTAFLLLAATVIGLCFATTLRLSSAVQLTTHHRNSIMATELLDAPVPMPKYRHGGANATEFGAMIWTIHFGYDNNGVLNFGKVENSIRHTKSDVVGLLESDLTRPFLGNRDMVEYLSAKLGMYSDFGPSTKDNTWGCALLSRFPILQSEHYLLPSPEGELACALRATLNVGGEKVDVVVTHMGNDRDRLDRKLQALELSRLARTANDRFLFLGYVTSAPGSPNYQQLAQGGHVMDIDEHDWDRWCQYIFYRGMERRSYARIRAGTIADTEIQMATFRSSKQAPTCIGREGVRVANANDISQSKRLNDAPPSGNYYYQRYWRTQEEITRN